jgi:cell division protein FtsL
MTLEQGAPIKRPDRALQKRYFGDSPLGSHLKGFFFLILLAIVLTLSISVENQLVQGRKAVKTARIQMEALQLQNDALKLHIARLTSGNVLLANAANQGMIPHPKRVEVVHHPGAGQDDGPLLAVSQQSSSARTDREEH